MKQRFTLLAFLFVFATGLFAQDAAMSPREIADAYIENSGGADKYKSLENIRMTGTSAMQGMEFPLTVTTATGDKLRVDVNVQGQKIIQAYDGETAWQVMPFQGITSPTAMTPEESQDLAETVFLPEFIDSEARGYTLSAVDGKEVEGTPTYGVRVTNEAGYDKVYYFDTEYLIPIMVETVGKGGQMKGMTTQVFMSDYQEVEGMMIPMFLDTKINGQSVQKVTIKEVEFDADLDDAMFSMPK